MKISDFWLREQIQEEFCNALKYGIRRAYKHSDLTPPSESQEDTIMTEIENAIDKVLHFETTDG